MGQQGATKAQPIPLYNVHMPVEVARSVQEVLVSGRLAAGPNVTLFETALKSYLGNPLVCSTGDASSSLAMCLYLAGVRPDDEVVMSPLACLATTCPVRNLFARVCWCDVDPMTGNIDPQDLRRRINSKTKAVLVYHWGGYPADIAAIHEVAREAGIAVIEDASEAIGAEIDGKRLGNHGSDAVVFSFYPNRHITTIEGAAVAFGREAFYEQARWLRRYGIHQPSFRDQDGEINPASDIPVAGWNTYMNHVAATIGVAQLQYLPRIIASFKENGSYYDKRLTGAPGVTLLNRPENSRPAYWVYTFLAEERDSLLKRLHKEGVCASRVHLRNDLYTCFGIESHELPGVDYFSAHCLSIPCGWWVTQDDRARIAEIICREVK